VPEAELSCAHLVSFALPDEIICLSKDKAVFLVPLDERIQPDLVRFSPEGNTIEVRGAPPGAFPLLLKLKFGNFAYVLTISARK
jgi:hypothetical protein